MRTILPSHRLNKASVDRHYIGHRRDGSTRPGSICIPKAMPDVDLASSLAAGFSGLVHSHGIALAYEPVALPCSMMRCGDVVHRSSLDLGLRGEETGLDWRGIALLATVGTYLFLPPGPIPGFIDTILGKVNRTRQRVYTKDDVIVGRKLATGGFGSVFFGDLKEENGSTTPVVIKKAKEYGEAEVWMNERVMRIGGQHCAEFVTAFEDSSLSPNAGISPLDNDIWLVWKYEGNNTLFDLMEKRNEFPYNMETLLFGRDLKLPKGPRRKLVTIRLIMRQLIEALKACHNAGIVHRDIKPQNCIVSSTDNKIKLIDLGAAADLRVGINYAPKEYLLDPRYAPPQMYVMSTQTVRPPPAPVAAFLSPVLWTMEAPDRFDMYSCGVTMLQLAFPSLRNDNAIILFNKTLQDKFKWDLRKWRSYQEGKGNKEFIEGFEMLSLDNNAGWELLCALMSYKPRDRPSASDALQHPFFQNADERSSSGLGIASNAIASASRSMGSVFASVDDAIMSGADEGLLTEARLYEELGIDKAAPVPTRQASSTIAWWQERQVDMKKKLTDKDKAGGTGKVGGTGKIRSEPRQVTDVADAAAGGNSKSKGWLGFMSKDKAKEEDSEDDDDDNDNGYEEEEVKKSKLSLMALISGKR